MTKGALVYATVINHEARHCSLWRQQGLHDKYVGKCMQHWAADKLFAMQFAPANWPGYYPPTEEPGFPAPEELLNQHAEIGDDIRAKQDEFSQLIALGEKMYKR